MPPEPGNNLALTVYAPAMTGGDARPLAVVYGLERALPGVRLAWTVSKDHRLLPLPQRDAWLLKPRRNGGFPLLCNQDEHHPVMVSGMEVPASAGPGGQPQLEVHSDMPLDATGIAVAAEVLEAVSEGARAFWGHATPFRTAVEISRQIRHPTRKPGVPPRGLPALKLREELRSPEVPHRLGWLNYWSGASARILGFPDPTRDADLLSRARRTASGGWVVSVTETPLDLDNLTHLDALLRAYERFPEIGGRSSPR